MINIDNKFMLFDCTCEFINKLDFYDETKQRRKPGQSSHEFALEGRMFDKKSRKTATVQVTNEH